jgi:hypothetical protein
LHPKGVALSLGALAASTAHAATTLQLEQPGTSSDVIVSITRCHGASASGVGHGPLWIQSYPAKANVRNHGFTPQERRGFDAFLKAGFWDTFRQFDKTGGHYTWWSVMGDARSRNVGWRIDYFLISATLRPRLQKAFLRTEQQGSDHCPVGIEIEPFPQ